MKAGDAITIFTPDPTHFPIALYAIERGIHVMITKPAVKTLEHHVTLIEAAKNEAERLQPDTANIAQLLGEALLQARNISGHGGRPDEGLRPDQLTTENDN